MSFELHLAVRSFDRMKAASTPPSSIPREAKNGAITLTTRPTDRVAGTFTYSA